MKRQASLPHNQIESEIAPVVLGLSTERQIRWGVFTLAK